MLQHLTIRNFAIIEELEIDFEEGMTVLTGETGAGKSIIIDAVGLLIGGRGASDFIRYHSDAFFLSGIFFMQDLAEEARHLLEELKIPFEDSQLLISREMHRSGKNVIRVNGVSLTVALLKQIGSYLVDIHGQNEHQTLMDASRHIDFLDHFASQAIQKDLTAYQEEYQHYQELQNEFDQLSLNEQELAQRLDLLRFQISEIDASQLTVGEDQALEEEREELQNYQKIAEVLQFVAAGLSYEELNVLDQVGQMSGELARLAGMNQQFDQFIEQMDAAYYGLQDLSSDIHHYMEDMVYDQDRLNHIEERLNAIQKLKRKYGQTIEDILAYADQARSELERLDHQESHQEELEVKLQASKDRLLELGHSLHEERSQAAKELEQVIMDQMKELYMAKAKFKVQIDLSNRFYQDGMDRVEFYITTNPGEPFKALTKVASGGELSRLMLAMKAVFQEAKGVTSIVFDEVDTGVSGRVAQAIAEKMYQISLGAQVLCISHLAQVAAMADQQLYIHKAEKDGRTLTQVKDLNREERIEELARILAGEQITESSRLAAEDQLDQASKDRKTMHDSYEERL
ncbi:DNA repair protein RecN [Aerococcus sp. UMB8487]|uniref:DNA repair protein RecN n=1 Tax=Aerococcus sp. UMB8487 TaxID=3046346 RepID=UPI00254DB304|nr:DNA repair protein RecN [Aerococcus sp. UMB8487]MDK6940904.1 DNA repair protein RecN [Aerococcus sp. UMB8487]